MAYFSLAIITCFLLILPSASYRRYLSGLPPALVPCPVTDGVSAQGCAGLAWCEAYGHVDCWTGSPMGDSEDGGDDVSGTSTGFGKGAASGWNLATCDRDDDGDKFTNGDELGDGCCNWPVLPLTSTTAPSNPSFASSVPAFASSCGKDGPQIPAPTVTTSNGGASVLTLSWSPPTTACVCEWRVNVTVVSTGDVKSVAKRSTNGAAVVVNVCGLPLGTPLTATVWGKNRGGSGLSTSLSGLQVTSSGGLPSGGCADTAGSAKTVGMNLVDSPAGVAFIAAAMKRPALPTIGAWWFVIALAIVLVPSSVVAHCVREGHFVRRRTTHSYCPIFFVGCRFPPHYFGKNAAPPAYLVKLLSVMGSYATDLRTAGWGHTLTIVAACAGLIACTMQTGTYYAWLKFPLGTGFPIARGAGYAAGVAMGLQLLPVARFSLWSYLLAVPFERALILHRWAGWATIALTWIHGGWIIAGYASAIVGERPSLVSWWWPLRWSTRDAVNPLAGLLSGLLMAVLAIGALDCARRARYELFLASHFTFPAIYALGWLHVRHSDTPASPLFALGFVLLAIDALLIGLDGLALRGTSVVDVGVCLPGGGLVYANSMRSIKGACACVEPPATRPRHGVCPSCGIIPTRAVKDALGAGAPFAVVLIMDKSPALGISWLFPFSYAPGQYVYVAVPSVSHFPHPISISSVPDDRSQLVGGMPGRFAVTIKGLRGDSWGDSWSGRVVASAVTMLKARAEMLDANAAAGIVQGSVDSLEAGDTHGADTRHAWPAPASGAHLPSSFDHELDFKAWATGPFGSCSLHLDSLSHFVLFAGGVGITPMAPLHSALVRGTRRAEAGCFTRHARSAPLGTLTTVWAVREEALMAVFAPLLRSDDRAKVRVFTGSGGGGRARDSTAPLPTESGRPNVASILTDAAALALKCDAQRSHSGDTLIGVLVCGPEEMVRDVLEGCDRANSLSLGVHFLAHRETFIM